MKKGNNDLTELVFVLDRSGSMHGLEEDTVGGFNAMLEKQRRAPGRALVSTILFIVDNLICSQTKDKCVFFSNFFYDLDIGTVHGS